MKYMGSKAWMLGNGLSARINRELQGKNRFVDLFAGAGSVSWHVASRHDLVVESVDLQQYSEVLCGAVLNRTSALSEDILKTWTAEAGLWLNANSFVARAARNHSAPTSGEAVANARAFAERTELEAGILSAYGGHYLSPWQAMCVDALRAVLPAGVGGRVCLAALLTAITRCAASPGHLAQPLQPGPNTMQYLEYYWHKDIFAAVEKAFGEINAMYAKKLGTAHTGDAVDFAAGLTSADLAFVDPPYTGVHYSRFYHVLEVVARGERPEVTGVGRYPPIEQRPQSTFSMAGQSTKAIAELLDALQQSGATSIMTFPAGDCSNGLSGKLVLDAARERFDVVREVVNSKFSTLGGRKGDRQPRQLKQELVLTLRPA